MSHPLGTNIPAAPVWPDAPDYLRTKDPVLAKLIEIGLGAPPKLEPVPDPFEALARAIMHRGWSAQMASRAIDKLRTLRPNFEGFPTAQQIVDLTIPELRETGLGELQAKCLWNAARRIADREIDLDAIDRLEDDEEVIHRLSALYGVKDWTAKMYLVFHRMRPDVLITGDKGLYRAAAKFYPDDLPAEPDWKAFEHLAKRWRPYRSAATWYLWTYGAGFRPGLHQQPKKDLVQ